MQQRQCKLVNNAKIREKVGAKVHPTYLLLRIEMIKGAAEALGNTAVAERPVNPPEDSTFKPVAADIADDGGLPSQWKVMRPGSSAVMAPAK